MAKRFFDTDLWDKEWFMPLPQKQKLLFQFLFAKCDAAGVWSPNYILASAYIGSKVTQADLKPLSKHLDFLPDGKIFLLDFIPFQYGELSENCPPHKKIISLLKKYGIFERVLKGYSKTTGSLQEEEEVKDIEEVEETETEEVKDGDPKKIIYPFDTKEFKENWGVWLEYKHQRKDKYTKIGEQGALKKLSRLAGGNVEIAISIIHQSIENNWVGLFELKGSAGKKQNGNYSEVESIIYGK